MASKSASKAHDAPVKPAPPAGRRNFRLSPLEMLIAALVLLGVLYLFTLWATNLLTPAEEQAAPAAPPNVLVERALTASEKVLAEQATISRELGSLRKQVESMQGQGRRSGGHASPGGEAVDAAQDKRLDEVDRRIDDLAKGLPSQLLPRLEKLEKEMAARPAAPATADTRELGARLDKLEKALAARPAAPAAAVDTSELSARLDKLEKALAARPAAPAAAVDTSELSARLDKLEKALAARAEAKPAPKAESKPAPRADTKPHKINHKVRPGETLMGVARHYKVSVDDILHWNAGQLGDRRLLLKGETLVIYAGPGNS